MFSFLTQKKGSGEYSGSLRGQLLFWCSLIATDSGPVGGWSLRQVGSFVYRFLSAALSFLGPKVTADRTQRR